MSAPLAWRVTIQTEHFEFAGHGATESEANESLGRALAAHGKQYGLPADWWSVYEFQTLPIVAGGYRDDHRMTD